MNYHHDFYTKSGGQSTLNCRGTLINLDIPRIMGVLNVTPDSFYDGNKFIEENQIVDHAGEMILHGATFIDIGAQSTRPGAARLPASEEIDRLIPAIEAVKKAFPEILMSIDTFYSDAANRSVNAGAVMVNDISAGSIDSNMFETIARLKVPYVLMHMQGDPNNMQHLPRYKNITEEVVLFLKEKMLQLMELGVHDVVIDPGFGFGKTVAHNFTLLKHLGEFLILGKPVMAGLSRKSMICKPLGITPADALNGTSALNMTALMNGARILRVHDVKEAAQVVRLFMEMKNS
jgi:dihydropteroate synthase